MEWVRFASNVLTKTRCRRERDNEDILLKEKPLQREKLKKLCVLLNTNKIIVAIMETNT